jgi:BACON domain-containing protein/S-layer family protein
MKLARIIYLVAMLIVAITVSESLSVRRTKADTFTVTTTADNGDNLSPTPGSLRKAILDANGNAGEDTISFNIPGAGVQTIIPPVALPTITGPVVIDGYTQPGASANTQAIGNDAVLLIELNGNGAAFAGLTITAGSSTVRGLVINRSADGIRLLTNGSNHVEGCFIGVDAAGTSDLANSRYGIEIESAGNFIGGTSPDKRNVIISASGSPALYLLPGNAGGNAIQGNYLGTNAAGTASLGRGDVKIETPSNMIGGTAAGAGNVIVSGTDALEINGAGGGSPNGNTVQGNYIGLTADGATALGTGGVAIYYSSSNLIGGTTAAARNLIARGITIRYAISTNNLVQGNYIGLNAAGTAAAGSPSAGPGVFIDGANTNTVGGTAAGAGNVIGNCANGVVISDSSNCIVQGNYIGTNAAGTAAIPNSNNGIVIKQVFGTATGNLIGGAAAGARNVISGNPQHGINIAFANGNTVQGNFIGVAADGTSQLSNHSHGISIAFSNNNIIGGTAAGAGNLIAFNGTSSNSSSGVQIENAGTGNSARGNSIFSNTGLGIDLGGAGVTQNDADDGDSGANNLQNFPTLTSALLGCGTTVSGTLNSTPNTTFDIDFFANPSCDPTCHGEGKTFLGSTSTVTDPSGNASFTGLLSTQAPGGSFITATATDPAGNTSEFSHCIFASSFSRTRECFTWLATTSSITLTLPIGCAWTAVSNVAWVQITSATSGTGSATINFSVEANPAATRRTGTLTIAGETFTVLQGAQYADVPQSHLFFNEIGRISALGITVGCGGDNYCPDQAVTREQMAAFIIRARGEFNPPQPAQQRFADVPPTNIFYAFIEQMAVHQITVGCGGNNYCPAQPVLREQMAAFIIRGLGIFNPPQPAQQRFADVPPSNIFYAFIEQMAVRGITLGCGGGNYCPEQPVTRGQMAAFLIRAFGCGDPMCLVQ